jgi:transposase
MEAPKMPRFKDYDYNQTKFVPISYDKQIIPGTFEYTLSYIIDKETDLSVFDCNYKNDEVGRPAWDPAIILKIILYAYSKGITSSRKIAAACRENVIFMALSADSQPHHTTISNFITSMEPQIVDLFRNVLYICANLGLIGGKMFAIDGCKMTSNASKEWSGTRGDLEKKKKKIKKTLKLIVKRHKKHDESESKAVTKPPKDDDTVKLLRSRIKKIKQFLDTSEAREGRRGKEIKSNITDNESAKLKSDHGFIQGYNGLSIADSKHQVVIQAAAFGTNNENAQLTAMIEEAEKNLHAIGEKKRYFRGKKLLADTGYFSESNLVKLEKAGIDAYIPDNEYRSRDERFASATRHKTKHKRFAREDFKYLNSIDKYICPNGNILNLNRRKVKIFNEEFGRVYTCNEAACGKCEKRLDCLKQPTTKYRRLWVPYKKNRTSPFVERMKKKIDSRRGKNAYSKRMGIIEPVFANIRWAKGLHRFTLRGRKKVNIQWMLYNLVHNIGKINSFGRRKCAIA